MSFDVGSSAGTSTGTGCHASTSSATGIVIAMSSVLSTSTTATIKSSTCEVLLEMILPTRRFLDDNYEVDGSNNNNNDNNRKKSKKQHQRYRDTNRLSNNHKQYCLLQNCPTLTSLSSLNNTTSLVEFEYQRDRYFSYCTILAQRCREMDNYIVENLGSIENNKHKRWQQRFLLNSGKANGLKNCYTTDNAAHYTSPLHRAVLTGDLRMIVFLLHQSIQVLSSASSSLSKSSSAASTTTTCVIPLKNAIQYVLSERQQILHQRQRPQQKSFASVSGPGTGTGLDYNLLLCRQICQHTDEEGFTPGQLLTQLQIRDLSDCRSMLQYYQSNIIHDEHSHQHRPPHRSSTNNSNSRSRSNSLLDDTTGTIDRATAVDHSQNEFHLLSQEMYHLSTVRDSSNNNDDNDDDTSDDDDNIQSSNIQHTEHCMTQGTTFGCEVLTFGCAHHCVLGVGKASNSNATNSLNGSTVTDTLASSSSASIRPQRVVEFALDNRRTVQDTAVAVAAAQYHTLVVTQQGSVYAFGLGRSGRLGTGTESPCAIPVRITGSLSKQKVVSVAAAENHSLAVTRSGHIFSWGSNRFGQLGIVSSGTYDNATSQTNTDIVLTPRRVDGILKGVVCTQVAAGAKHSVALSNDGIVYVWGDNSSGQLGVITPGGSSGGSNNRSSSNIQVVTSLLLSSSAVSVSSTSTSNTKNNSRKGPMLNKKVSVTRIAASDHSTLVLGQPVITKIPGYRIHPTNVVYSWGHGNHVPTKVIFPTEPSNVGVDSSSTQNVMSSHGDTSKNNTYSPRRSGHNEAINPVRIACARYHNVAITEDGKVYTWGLHADSLGAAVVSSPTGTRGSGTTKKLLKVASTGTKTVPGSLSSPNGKKTKAAASLSSSITQPNLVLGMLHENGGGHVVDVAASDQYTAVITNTGDLYTWGESYQPLVLGHAGVRYQPSPKRVPAVHRAVSVAVAKEHTVVLMGTAFPTVPTVASLLTESATVRKHQANNNKDQQLKKRHVAHVRIPTLETLAGRKVTEHIDIFNILPVYLVAERTRTPSLLNYCNEFIRRNMDGVLNVSQRRVLDSYIHECQNGISCKSLISSLYDNCFSSSYRDDDTIHPFAVDILSAGSVVDKVDPASFTPNKTICTFPEWMQACEKLRTVPAYKQIIAAQKQKSSKAITTNMANTCIARRRTRSLSNVSNTSESSVESRWEGLVEDSFISDRCSDVLRMKDIESSSMTTERLQVKLTIITKEIRAVRKRLVQIEKIEASITKGDVVTSHTESVTTNANDVPDPKADACLVLNTEQQQKISRRPQLEADLEALQRAKTTIDTKIDELRAMYLIESARQIVTSVQEEAKMNDFVTKSSHSVTTSILVDKKTPTKSIARCKVSFVEEDLIPKKEFETATIVVSSEKDDNSDVNEQQQRFSCSVCNIVCPDKNSLDLHMNGRKHRNRVIQFDEEERKLAAKNVLEESQKRVLLNEKSNAPTTVKCIQPTCPWSAPKATVNCHPKYRLPPPPHPISDIVPVTKSTVPVEQQKQVDTAVAASLSAETPKKVKSLMEIMSEELESQKKKAVPVQKAKQNISETPHSKSPPLLLPAGTTNVLKSAPWLSSTAIRVDVPSIVYPASNTKVVSFASHSTDTVPLSNEKLAKSDASVTKVVWNTAPPTKKIHTTLPLQLTAKQTTIKPIVSSFTSIQEQEERNSKMQVDQTTYTADGKNKWFVETRDRAATLAEIQQDTIRREEELAMVAEQYEIERQILADIEAAKAAAEKKVKKKGKVKKNASIKQRLNDANATADSLVHAPKSVKERPRQGAKQSGHKKQKSNATTEKPTTPTNI